MLRLAEEARDQDHNKSQREGKKDVEWKSTMDMLPRSVAKCPRTVVSFKKKERRENSKKIMKKRTGLKDMTFGNTR